MPTAALLALSPARGSASASLTLAVPAAAPLPVARRDNRLLALVAAGLFEAAVAVAENGLTAEAIGVALMAAALAYVYLASERR